MHASSNWQALLAQSFKSAKSLLTYLQFTPDEIDQVQIQTTGLSINVPLPFAQRMRPRDWQDPLLRQVLALSREFSRNVGFSSNPLEEAWTHHSGILKKYAHRALFLVKGQCAIHCQYCFRQHFPYSHTDCTPAGWEKAIQVVKDDSSIHELILSGGDPLFLRDDRFSQLLDRLESIPQLKLLRIHTRLPIVLPQRVTQSLCKRLSHCRMPIALAVHCNHPNELDDQVGRSLRLLKACGVQLLNQSVLLKGINDHPEILACLSYKLFESGTLPYYLHLLDPVTGAESYWVSDQKAREIMRSLLVTLPGYLVPRCVREVPNAPSKVPLDLLLMPAADQYARDSAQSGISSPVG